MQLSGLLDKVITWRKKEMSTSKFIHADKAGEILTLIVNWYYTFLVMSVILIGQLGKRIRITIKSAF